MEGEEREMDFTKSSMDMLSLNNLVVSLRGVMKRARLHVINKVNRQSKQLRTLKATAEREVLNQRKSEKLVQEIGIIKELNIDQAIKYALGNTDSFDQVAKGGDLELKAMTRLATNPIIHEKVCKWRKEHEDWKALAAFLMSKNTGRRFKKRKHEGIQDASTQEKGFETCSTEPVHKQLVDVPCDGPKKKKQRDGPSAKELAKQAALEASKKRVEQLLAVRLARKTGSLAGNIGHKDDEFVPVTNAEKGMHTTKDEDELEGSSSDDSVAKVEKEIQTKKVEVAEDSDSDESVPQVETEMHETDVEGEGSSNDGNVIEKGIYKTKDEEAKGSNSNDSDEDATSNAAHEGGDKSSEESVSLASSSDTDADSVGGEEPTKDESPVIRTPKKLEKLNQKDSQRRSPKGKVPKVESKTNTEMEIRALNLSNISADQTEIPVSQQAEEQIPFLFKGREGKRKAFVGDERRKKDTFFASLDGSSDDDEDGVRNIEDGAQFMNAGDAVDEDDAYPSFTRQKIESTFVGALSTHQRQSTRGRFGHREGRYEKMTSGPSSHREDRFFPRGRGRGSWRGDNSSSRIRSRGSAFGSTERSTAAHTQQTGGASDRAAKPLHPSWEASRKRKEQQNKIPSFQGKKIKFDD